MFMLPQRARRRRQILERVLDQGCSVHLVVEDFVVGSRPEVDRLEELLDIDRLAAQAPRDIALD
jgi:hypothetical protein